MVRAFFTFKRLYYGLNAYFLLLKQKSLRTP